MRSPTHVAQGRTVTGGRAVIAGTEDRQHAYVALSCGTDTNTAYVFTVSPKLADPMPGPRPAPELARYDRITAERTVQQAAVATETQHALAVLSGVLDRNGQQLSAPLHRAAPAAWRRHRVSRSRLRAFTSHSAPTSRPMTPRPTRSPSALSPVSRSPRPRRPRRGAAVRPGRRSGLPTGVSTPASTASAPSAWARRRPRSTGVRTLSLSPTPGK